MGKKNKKKHNNQHNHSHNDNMMTEGSMGAQPVSEPVVTPPNSPAGSTGPAVKQPSEQPQIKQAPKDGKGNKKNNTILGAITLLVIVVAIVLAIVLPDKSPEKQAEREAAKAEKQQMREQRAAEREAAKAEKDEEEAMEELEKNGTETGAMTPIEEGEFVYRFDGIEWVFEADDEEGVGVPVTKVSFNFENFTRYEGAEAAVFGSPYLVGVFEGECVATDLIEYDTQVETGTPLAYATCSFQDGTTDVAVFQEDNNVVLKSRTGEEIFTEVRTIDITTVLR